MSGAEALLLVTALAGAPGDPEPPSTEQEEIDRALAADAAAVAAASQPRPAEVALVPSSAFNPDLSLVADFAVAWFGEEDVRQTGAHDPSKTGFNLQQLELSASKSVDPYFRFNAFLVFGQFGVEVEEAYATTSALPANLQLRVGQFLTRLGRLNPTHPHAWDFVDQPLAIGRLFGAEGNRGLGLEGSWLSPLPWYLELVASVTDAAGEATARSFFGARALSVRSPLDLQALLAVRQFFPLSDDWSLLWGLSSVLGPNATGHHNRTEIFATDVYVKYRPVRWASYTSVALQTEWFYRRRQVPDDVLQDVSGYALLAWRFAHRWGTAVRYELGSAPWDRAGRTRADDLDPTWDSARHRTSAQVTFWPTEFSRLRLQGGADGGGGADELGWAIVLALEVVVGAHGAHAF